MESEYTLTEEGARFIDEFKQNAEKEKLYDVNHELQKISLTLPSSQRLDYDVVMNVARKLCEDETIYQIVDSLRDIQKMKEQECNSTRLLLQQQYDEEKAKVMERHEAQILRDDTSQVLSQMTPQIDDEIKKLDENWEHKLRTHDHRTIRNLDDLVTNQQRMLEGTGMPTFFITSEPAYIQKQMTVLYLIMRLMEKQKDRTEPSSPATPDSPIY